MFIWPRYALFFELMDRRHMHRPSLAAHCFTRVVHDRNLGKFPACLFSQMFSTIVGHSIGRLSNVANRLICCCVVPDEHLFVVASILLESEFGHCKWYAPLHSTHLVLCFGDYVRESSRGREVHRSNVAPPMILNT